MLPTRKLWHIAPQQAPETEARVLFFSSTSANAGAAPDHTPGAAHTSSTEELKAPEGANNTSGENTQNVQHETAAGIHTVLDPDSAEEAEVGIPQHKTVLEKAREVSGMFDEIRGKLNNKQFKEYIESQGADGVDAWKKTTNFLAREDWRVNGDLLAAENIDQWMEGQIEAPRDFVATLAEILEDERDSLQYIDGMEDVLHAHAREIAQWNNMSYEQRMPIIKEMAEAGNFAAILGSIEAKSDIRKEVAEDERDKMKIMQTFYADHEKKMESAGQNGARVGIRGKIKGFFNAAGVEFYSPLQVWDAFKLIQENWEKAYKDKAKLKTGILAKDLHGLVKWAPYGTEVGIALDQHVDHDYSAASKEWAEHLEHEDVEWSTLFDSHGHHGPAMLDQMIAMGERNKATGILEYAAKRGWLYDINKNPSVPMEQVRILGRRLIDICPLDWRDHHFHRMKTFLTLLRGQNMGGVNSEIEKNTNEVQGIEDTEMFIKMIDTKLDDGNLWGAVGVAARALDRGLKADVSPWIMNTFLRHMEENHIVREHSSIIFLDKLGKLAAYRSSFCTGMFQTDRKGMMKWIENKDAPVEQAPLMGKIVAMLRADILDACGGKATKKDLDRAVSLVMAAHLLDQEEVENAKLDSIHLKPGRSISIYDNKYSFYRNNPSVINVNPAAPGIPKEDTDYWVQICENQYGGEQIYKELLKNDGRGSFTNEDRVPDFFGLIIKQYEQLKKAGQPQAAENFRREAGKKITDVLTQTALNDSRTAGMYLLTLRQHRTGEFMLKTLIEEGFFDINAVIDAHWQQKQGKDVAKSLLMQIDSAAFKQIESARNAKPQDEALYQTAVQAFRSKARPPNWATTKQEH